MKTLLAVAVLALTACGPRPEQVFVCEDDGALVENHVGVHEARREYHVWTITYTDGRTADYTQPDGETCWLEYSADER